MCLTPSACKARTMMSAPISSSETGGWPAAAVTEAVSALWLSMMNLSRISETKNLGCPLVSPCGDASGLEAKAMGGWFRATLTRLPVMSCNPVLSHHRAAHVQPTRFHEPQRPPTRLASPPFAAAHGLLVVRRHVAVWGGVHRWLPVQHPNPDPPRAGQPARPTGVFVRGVWHLFQLVLGQGPDPGHENLAHPCGEPPRTGLDPSPSLSPLRVQLGVVSAAVGAVAVAGCARAGSHRAHRRLGGGVGHFVPLQPRAPILARHLGRHTLGPLATHTPLNPLPPHPSANPPPPKSSGTACPGCGTPWVTR